MKQEESTVCELNSVASPPPQQQAGYLYSSWLASKFKMASINESRAMEDSDSHPVGLHCRVCGRGRLTDSGRHGSMSGLT
ncbi:hypothetical protein VFPPC_15132 [Pochonia chlamydosporia 170]|uniref:Uncharacterized protein n=1 Tax=Pochonia chlamydosporia 170 TaxID=1380566 RepID=A0A179G3J7_METCM|nr:hypothetical protein VFPPC_15132 [Pochonia chlamydosporia 170]OAQ72445.1 hypothetical protein VFPPC_15132 [Pochonia chlamydosporia 170]